jgi:hypothetical protein
MGAVNSLSCDTLSLCFSLTNYPIYPPSSSVNNDFVEVDELILEIADYKNDYARYWPTKNGKEKLESSRFLRLRGFSRAER